MWTHFGLLLASWVWEVVRVKSTTNSFFSIRFKNFILYVEPKFCMEVVEYHGSKKPSNPSTDNTNFESIFLLYLFFIVQRFCKCKMLIGLCIVCLKTIRCRPAEFIMRMAYWKDCCRCVALNCLNPISDSEIRPSSTIRGF